MSRQRPSCACLPSCCACTTSRILVEKVYFRHILLSRKGYTTTSLNIYVKVIASILPLSIPTSRHVLNPTTVMCSTQLNQRARCVHSLYTSVARSAQHLSLIYALSKDMFNTCWRTGCIATRRVLTLLLLAGTPLTKPSIPVMQNSMEKSSFDGSQ